ncbi:MAG: CaiB/BaiF CoA transferase family protein [Acidimicrobiales bacterium]
MNERAAWDRPGAGPGPLTGFRVLDLSSVVMGPMATSILGDLGAEIITVESEQGDTNRAMGPGPHPQLSGVSLNLLRNKRNVDLDLKSHAGKDLLLRLAATCDVFVTNLRPGPLARLGASYPDLVGVRGDIVYCQAQGWPSDTARADDPAYDDIIQAASGVADLTQRIGGPPSLMPTIFADKVAGLTIAYAILAALVHRERTGQGQHIEVPMVDAVTAFLLVEHGAAAIPRPPLGPGGYQRILTPQRRPHRSSDGWIAILPYSKDNYDTLFKLGSRHDLIGDRRYSTGRARIANSDFLYSQVREIVLERTTAEWLEICTRHSIPATEVARIDDIIEALPDAEHPVVGAYKLIPPPVRFARTPASVRRPAPLIGQHNHEVLSELGLTDSEITHLEATGVVRTRLAPGSDPGPPPTQAQTGN